MDFNSSANSGQIVPMGVSLLKTVWKPHPGLVGGVLCRQCHVMQFNWKQPVNNQCFIK